MTVILSLDEIKKCIGLDKQLIPIIEEAFKNLAQDKVSMPPILRLDIEEYHGESDVKAAYIQGLDSYAIKVASGFFNNPKIGLPSSNGLMILLDSKTGVIKSILLDKGYLTDIRTAIAGAIAAKYLSNPDSKKVGIIGAGIQAKLQLEALSLVRNIDTAFIWARKKDKVSEFIADIKKLNINIQACLLPEEVVNQCEILVTTTPSKSPLIKNEWLKKGLHITAMGSDAEQKNELDPLIIKDCDLYIPDSLSQTKILGELNHAIKNNLVSSNQNYNELGEVILDPSLGRKRKEDITVCDLTGTGVQDTAIARQTYEIAMHLKLGTSVD
ncbi:MAG: Delta(1)-pyrroline-2-carboxylate reductase [Alphaproteobacteria bacterium MarineAlpha5_Bin8]|nr:MAG: Delta(1)-pyrroline-2-carboxylate reductase [Alphaproteobacteria bacterium MarineAlpha5_Bin7]PPR47166.1 MAG: Delta(1)-pyrroline-2-carboxylate reductase [Alphaproteobacteria bacterium MarineAlpha5_Bin8]PPR54188.1 MAG: Delta(1)-pyrroline-2-carboxylate reductase [Alphaproteobacteria bacterium MarineAlpha5_Bin6]|tara:strand:- start:1216 stop:2196 length:981 start_codon:yes stop_codon:yes gene_type:complete